MLFKRMKISDKKPMKEAMKKNGWREGEVQLDLLRGLVLYSLMIGKKYISFNSEQKSYIYLTKELLWVYPMQMSSENKSQASSFREGYNMVLIFQDKMKYVVNLNTEVEKCQLLVYIAKNYPHVILDYSDALMDAYEHDFERLVDISREKETMNN